MLNVAPSGVDIWTAVLSHEDATWAWSLLDEEERNRALRFRAPGDREGFVSAHGRLRRILAGYVGCPPAALRISRSCQHCGDERHGKPRLETDAGEPSLSFTMSRTRALAIYAIGAAPLEIGIDVERIDALPWAEIGRDFLAPLDRAALARLPARQQLGRYPWLWVRKEACLKAMGVGLALDPREYPLGAGLNAISGWARMGPKDGAAPPMWGLDLEAPPGHAAALAATAPDRVVRYVAA